MIIDFHTHCFPDALAERALGKLSAIGGIPTYTNGTVADTVRALDDAGIDRAVICNIATNDRQTTNVNNFAIATHAHPRLYALGSVNPTSSEDFIDTELTRLHAAGIKGIKIHPDYMGVEIDDARFDPIFARAAELGLFVITHAGWDFISPDKIHATPTAIARVLEKHPRLNLVAAHFGGNRQWDDVEELLIGRRVWLDLSLTEMFSLDPAQYRRMILAHSSDHLLFGSDLPWCDPAKALGYLSNLDLPSDLMEKICEKNALALVGKK
ncbi:MAG: amidohydrolase family protein [Clostridia bacterium]|nr:amidohydrolase family protein [Clostridia bacterium]